MSNPTDPTLDLAQPLSAIPQAEATERLREQAEVAEYLPPDLPEAARAARRRAVRTHFDALETFDKYEELLKTQMLAVHAIGMDCMRRTVEPDTAPKSRSGDIADGFRLLGLYTRQFGQIDRHRRLTRYGPLKAAPGVTAPDRWKGRRDPSPAAADPAPDQCVGGAGAAGAAAGAEPAERYRVMWENGPAPGRNW